jgi:hypothetical protein
MKSLVCILVALTGFVSLGYPASATEEVSLGKRQLSALLAAVDAMRSHGYTYRGQQVVISDHGDTYHITFMEDPIDVRYVGGHNANGWEVRKRDSRVLRELLIR